MKKTKLLLVFFGIIALLAIMGCEVVGGGSKTVGKTLTNTTWKGVDGDGTQGTLVFKKDTFTWNFAGTIKNDETGVTQNVTVTSEGEYEYDEPFVTVYYLKYVLNDEVIYDLDDKELVDNTEMEIINGNTMDTPFGKYTLQ